SMAPGVVNSEVSLDLDKTGLAAIRAYQQHPDQCPGYVAGVPGKEVAVENLFGPVGSDHGSAGELLRRRRAGTVRVARPALSPIPPGDRGHPSGAAHVRWVSANSEGRGRGTGLGTRRATGTRLGGPSTTSSPRYPASASSPRYPAGASRARSGRRATMAPSGRAPGRMPAGTGRT